MVARAGRPSRRGADVEESAGCLFASLAARAVMADNRFPQAALGTVRRRSLRGCQMPGFDRDQSRQAPGMERSSRLDPRDLAYCGLFGAAALLLPAIFHLVRLGHVFMPMYLPLVALAFFVRPLPAAITAILTPVLSGALTGMPPFFPPVAVFMAIELAAMAAVIAWVVRCRPRVNAWAVLVPVLLMGRVLYVGLVYAFSLAIELPASFMAGLSLLGGWPGIVLMIVVVPPVVRAGRRTAA